VQTVKLQRLLEETAVQLRAGRLEKAARLCQQARAIAPGDFNALNLSGLTALQQERYGEAAGWLERAARLHPRNAGGWLRAGFALAKLARHADAEVALRKALALAPGDAEAWDTLGYVLKAGGQLGEAIKAHRCAVELNPARANSWYNLGHALLFAGQPGEALACQLQALAAEPGFAKAHFGRALALQQCHRIPEAVAAFGAALQVEPDNHAAGSYRLMALNYLDGTTRESLLAEHAAYGQRLGAATSHPGLDQLPQPHRKLRLAFLSPDLREHSVAYFLEPILAHLKPGEFEVVLYHDHFVIDATTDRLRQHAVLFRNFIGQPDESVEAVIRADGPDVLVDLAGHTGMNRLPLLARRLAPVQISYLGYPNTTGLAAMDYRFVDAFTDPVDEAEAFHTEQLVRFSTVAWSYRAPEAAPEPAPRPCTAGAPVTFGCFNNFAKVTDQALAAWARLLAAVPGSRLKLKAVGLGESAVNAQVRGRLVQAGLEPARVDLLERTPDAAGHLALYQGIDVALDTFPYHGTTTTCEALWMGVPVVTLTGDRHASRVSGSLLHAVGHPEWIARDWNEYVQRAARLAANPAELTEQSRGLRGALRASPLMDHAGQGARFSAAVRDCWMKWCASLDAN
jgi:predicted O-linked N-acetylglucosamine transferase (SPINDLY family)